MRCFAPAIMTFMLTVSCSAQDQEPWEDGADRAGPPRGEQGEGGQRPPRTPPPEAFAACEDKSETDACSVETPRGTLEGVCLSAESALFCAPEGGPPR